MSNPPVVVCPECESLGPHQSKGIRRCKTVDPVRRWLCRGCKRGFTKRTGTVLSGLRTAGGTVASALHARSEGCGVRSTGRLVGKTHGSVMRWERRIEKLGAALPEELPEDFVPVIESDEVYTKVGHNRPAAESTGWTACGIERSSRFCSRHTSGQRDAALFAGHTHAVLAVAGAGEVHFVSDGEARYANELWTRPEAVTVLPGQRTGQRGRPPGSKKCLRKGMTVRRKVKGSQQSGPTRRQRYETPLQHHPESQLLPNAEVHANHSEAYNASLRRRSSPFRRRTNMYAKNNAGLDRALGVQRVIYNWVRPHWGHQGEATPAQVAGLADRKWDLQDLLELRA